MDQTRPVVFGMPAETYGFYNNSPIFALVEGFASQRAAVVARYPNTGVLASGWLRGEECYRIYIHLTFEENRR